MLLTFFFFSVYFVCDIEGPHKNSGVREGAVLKEILPTEQHNSEKVGIDHGSPRSRRSRLA